MDWVAPEVVGAGVAGSAGTHLVGSHYDVFVPLLRQPVRGAVSGQPGADHDGPGSDDRYLKATDDYSQWGNQVGILPGLSLAECLTVLVRPMIAAPPLGR